jgi:hypothetical protein
MDECLRLTLEASLQVLSENVKALRLLRDACLREAIGADGELTEKGARPTMLAAIESLRRHSESYVKLVALVLRRPEIADGRFEEEDGAE